MSSRRRVLKSSDKYLTPADAVRLLGVKPATLYTYVSRGWIRRLPIAGRKESLYLREDVEKVRARSGARASDGVLAAAAIRYGEPIVPTSVTEITPEGPHYRNRSAIELALNGIRFEATAELLWTGILMEGTSWVVEPLTPSLDKVTRELAPLHDSPNIHDAFVLVTASTGMALGKPHQRIGESASDKFRARQLIFALTGCFGLLPAGNRYRAPQSGERVAEALARSMGVEATTTTIRALDAALSLSADHELNPATFVARIAASSEGDLHSCIVAALGANSGTRIARGCDRLEDYFRDPSVMRRAMLGLTDLRGSEIATAGLMHPLYPAGDPRGRCLIDIVRGLAAPRSSITRLIASLDAAERHYELHPRLELALAVFAIALRLPRGAAAGIYTLGRIAGWVAHIAEQRRAGFLIRPRARFHSTGG